MNDCQNYLTGETNEPKERLATLCDRHGFSEESCDAALATLPSTGKLTRKGIKPFCAALESSRGADKVIARLQHRRSQKGATREVQMVNLDKAVSSKKGQPDYLVASDDPPVFEEPPSPLAHPPPSPVDMTIAQPPDANGNPYDEPQWGVNGAQGVVPVPAPPPATPAEPEAAPAEPAPAETPAESEAAPEESAPAESEEAPLAEEAAPEDSDAAPAEAEPVEEEASEEAPAEAEEEAEPEAAEAEAAETEGEPEAEEEAQ